MPHFAHASGLADPDCENYFSNVYFPGGTRKAFNFPSVGNEDPLSRFQLLFEFSASGPTLIAWFPPARSPEPWSGAVQFEAFGVSREFRQGNLRRGHLVRFNLTTGEYRIGISGTVSDDYVSQLELGRQTLDARNSVFDATTSPGRQMGSFVPIRLGDAVWVVTRNASLIEDPRARSASCETRGSLNGWYVYYIELPDLISIAEIVALSQWLERPIRPRQARIWIESPWPISVGLDGVDRFPLLDIGVTLASDQLLELAIEDEASKTIEFRAERATLAVWRNPKVGRWAVFGNGQRIFAFDVTDRAEAPKPAISIEVPGFAYLDLFAGQEVFDKAIALGERPEQISLDWCSPRVPLLVRTDAGRYRFGDEDTHLKISTKHGLEISAGSLGVFRCTAFPVLETEKVDRREAIRHEAIALAKWLIGLAGRDSSGVQVSVDVPVHLRQEPLIRRLLNLTWPVWLAPQVAALNRLLRDEK